MNSVKIFKEQRDSDEHPIDAKVDANECEESPLLNTNETDGLKGAYEECPMLHNNKTAEISEPKKENIRCSDKEKNRKVSFPTDKNLVTGYFEPVNPWEGVSRVSADELCNLYKASCVKHKTEPLVVVLNHLKSLDNTNEHRTNNLDLHNQILTHENVECLEEILKHIQYKAIDVSGCQLDDVSAAAIFDMVEFYEAANELNISDNKDITNRGWQSSVNMVKRSQSLEVLEARGVPISEISASNLGKALFGSCLHTIKLEHCGMTGRPIATFCHALRKVNVLKELWLSNNDLNSFDAYNIGCLLKVNYSIQFLDISNNNIQDEGISYLADALIQQNNCIRNPSSDSCSVHLDYSELSASLNLLNNNKSLSPSFKKLTINSSEELYDKQKTKSTQFLSNNNNNFNDEDQELEKHKEMATFTSENLKKKEEKEQTYQCEIAEKIDDKDPSKEMESLSLKKTQPLESFLKVTLNDEMSEKDAKYYPERSFSSESLNSLASIDSNDSKSSIRIIEAKFSKNGTLERQQSTSSQFEESIKGQTGLQVLLLWNNKITKNSSKSFSELLSTTTVLQILNIGRNNLGNDFLFHIKPSIKANLSLTSLGLQACHLSCSGIKALSEVIEFGGNSILQRIDLRDNNLQCEGLESLNDALKSNRSITQIDLDDTPRKFSESFDSTNFNRLINNIRAHCKRNSSAYVDSEQTPTTTTVETSFELMDKPWKNVQNQDSKTYVKIIEKPLLFYSRFGFKVSLCHG
ncbi:protein phosphatase 1 regulatory subunit 37 [Culicoides brevitarsis]|uniref:protein phosphatase 1 regulatory subunit 37 n=1 Tax=Culicoides brevitarsis TaxID=469753 RepID=UPI00307B9194